VLGLEDQQRTVAIIAAVVVIGLEMWRRALRRRAPRWVHGVTLSLLPIIAGGVAYTQWQLSRLAASHVNKSWSEMMPKLRSGRARAMYGNAIAFVAVILAVVVLGIGEYLARQIPHSDDVPVAELR